MIPKRSIVTYTIDASIECVPAGPRRGPRPPDRRDTCSNSHRRTMDAEPVASEIIRYLGWTPAQRSSQLFLEMCILASAARSRGAIESIPQNRPLAPASCDAHAPHATASFGKSPAPRRSESARSGNSARAKRPAPRTRDRNFYAWTQSWTASSTVGYANELSQKVPRTPRTNGIKLTFTEKPSVRCNT